MRIKTDKKIKKLQYNKCIEKFKVTDGEQEEMDAIIIDVMKDNTIENRLNEIYDYDRSTYIHSMEVAILSLMVGETSGFGQDRLRELCISAMLHDYGKTRIPIEIIGKPDKIDIVERQIMEAHPALGVYFLKNNNFSEDILAGIYEHHESYGGTERGYPRSLVKNEIHEFGRIISVADKIDAFTAKRIYHDERSIEDLYEYISNNEDVDQKIVKQLFDRVEDLKEILRRKQQAV